MSTQHDSSVPSPAPTLAGVCICVTLAACTLAFSFHLTSFLHAKEAVLAVGLAALAAVGIVRPGQPRPDFAGLLPLWILLGAAAGWTCVFNAAAVPALAIEDGVRFAMLLFFAALAWTPLHSPPWRERILDTIVWSASTAGALALLQYAGILDFLLPPFENYDQRAYSVFGNQGLLGGYCAVALPLGLASSGNRVMRAVCVALLAAALVVSGARTAWLAAALGIALWALLARPGRGALWLAVLVALAGAAAAALTWQQTLARVTEALTGTGIGGPARIWFWSGTLRMLASAPWTGIGLGNFQYFSPRFLGEALLVPGGEHLYHNELDTFHAHNEFLELVAETGILGACFCAWMAIRLLRRVNASEVRNDAGLWGALAALATFSGFNATLHSVPHALAGLLLVSALMPRRSRQSPRKRATALLPLATALALAASFVWNVLLPSAFLCAAEDAHVSGRDALPLYVRALAHPWPAALAREEYGMALLETGQPEAAYAQLLAARGGRDSGRLHLLLGRAARVLGKEEAARLHYEACLARWPDNAEAWSALLSLTGGDAHAAWIDHGRRWGLRQEKTSVE